MGPTASGKTDYALALAKHLPAEIVSVDSALVYRHMDIGTAKPDPGARGTVPHHLIDVADPAEPYSAGRFREDALAAMEAIRGRGRIPLLVGGTMLYFRALQQGLARLPPADEATRRRIEDQARVRGWPAMHRELEKVDPEAAARIRPTDGQRIQRALEVWELTGCPLTRLQRAGTAPSAWAFLKLAMAGTDRPQLHRAIEERFDAMLAAGLEAEVRRLHARGDLGPQLPSVRAVGYRQLWGWLEGEYDREEAIRRAVTATRRLAKRQMTWLRSEPSLEWLPDPPPEPAVLAGRIARWAGISAGRVC
ncbi:MAG: tRNA (adenosine(37)-N6)-dimethylallyltransferase MiaA [Gammaproteobacteria bacterium]